jgi:hypothetical protein
MQKKRRLCDDCRLKEERHAEGYRHLLTRTGVVERKLPMSGGYVSRETVFSPRLPLQKSCKAGHFLDALLRIVVDESAEYVPCRHRQWLTAMLCDLADATVTDGWPSRASKVADLPLDRLAVGAHEWVEAICREAEAMPILPYFALATAEFVAAHYEGDTFYSAEDEHCRIEGFIAESPRRRSFDFLRDSSFKREFTQFAGHATILAEVPAGARIYQPSTKQELGPGTQLAFVIERCPLSSGVSDYASIRFEEPQHRYNFFHSFEGYGHVESHEFMKGEVPIIWVVAQKVWASDAREAQWERLPAWLVGDSRTQLAESELSQGTQDAPGRGGDASL